LSGGELMEVCSWWGGTVCGHLLEGVLGLPPPPPPPWCAILFSGPRLRACDWNEEDGLLLGTWASELLIIPPGAAPRVVTRGHAQHAPAARGGAAGVDPDGEASHTHLTIYIYRKRESETEI